MYHFSISFHPTFYLCLSFAPGAVLCCLTSALITALEDLPQPHASHVSMWARPRGAITLKSSKSAHVKLREVFQEPTQVSEGVNWELLEARFTCQNTLDDSDYITKWGWNSVSVSPKPQRWCGPACWWEVRCGHGWEVMLTQRQTAPNICLNCKQEVELGIWTSRQQIWICSAAPSGHKQSDH